MAYSGCVEAGDQCSGLYHLLSVSRMDGVELHFLDNMHYCD